MSFYDWYADLPTSFPEIWGDQTDVCESADWYNSKFIVSMASNLNMTRTPDVHFIAEARTEGTKFVVLSPDFSQIAKYCDEWIPIQAGQDTRAVDGGQSRHPQGVLHRSPGPVFHRLREALHRSSVPCRTGAAMGRVIRRGGCCAPSAWRATRTSKTATGRCWSSTPRAASRARPRARSADRWGSDDNGKWNLSEEDSWTTAPSIRC